MIRFRIMVSLLVGLLPALPVLAHEVRPAYLELTESVPEQFSVLWKVPMRGDLKLGIAPRLPENCTELTPVTTYHASAALVQRWTAGCAGGLTGRTIFVERLSNTLTDVLVHVVDADGSAQTLRLTPAEPAFVVQARPSPGELAMTYLDLGVEHILLGIDHLLFVLALLIIVKGWKCLVVAITSFTLAHSITLAAATLGYVHVPGQPVEAVIALSILFLATEIVHGQQGKAGVAERSPWVVAFIFGLLHGFGFAGALAEVGMPEHAIPLALLFFNIGVELGQIAFVTAVLAVVWVAGNVRGLSLRSARMGTTYSIGGMAAYWTIERVTGIMP